MPKVQIYCEDCMIIFEMNCKYMGNVYKIAQKRIKQAKRFVTLDQRMRNSQKATALAAATFREST